METTDTKRNELLLNPFINVNRQHKKRLGGWTIKEQNQIREAITMLEDDILKTSLYPGDELILTIKLKKQ